MVTHPLQDATLSGAVTNPGFALPQAYARKVAGARELCRQEGLAFIPLAQSPTADYTTPWWTRYGGWGVSNLSIFSQEATKN